jgi:ATP-dependent Zn protease
MENPGIQESHVPSVKNDFLAGNAVIHGTVANAEAFHLVMPVPGENAAGYALAVVIETAVRQQRVFSRVPFLLGGSADNDVLDADVFRC